MPLTRVLSEHRIAASIKRAYTRIILTEGDLLLCNRGYAIMPVLCYIKDQVTSIQEVETASGKHNCRLADDHVLMRLFFQNGRFSGHI